MLGKNLRGTFQSDKPVREAALFGIFGRQANVTDGHYVSTGGLASPCPDKQG